MAATYAHDLTVLTALHLTAVTAGGPAAPAAGSVVGLEPIPANPLPNGLRGRRLFLTNPDCVRQSYFLALQTGGSRRNILAFSPRIGIVPPSIADRVAHRASGAASRDGFFL